MKNVIMIIGYSFYLIFQVFRMIKFTFISKIKGSEAAEQYLGKAVVKWARSTNKYFGVKVNVTGLQLIPNGPKVFISNHQGNFDIPILLAILGPVGFISKKEVFNIPVIRYWMKKLHCVGFDRENIRDAVRMIKEGSENLKNGYSMLIFPEGTRAKDGVMEDFKSGSFKLATKSKAPIVPITIDGSNKLYEIDGKLKKGTVNITFHPPIYTSQISREEEKVLHLKVQEIVSSSLKK